MITSRQAEPNHRLVLPQNQMRIAFVYRFPTCPTPLSIWLSICLVKCLSIVLLALVVVAYQTNRVCFRISIGVKCAAMRIQIECDAAGVGGKVMVIYRWMILILMRVSFKHTFAICREAHFVLQVFACCCLYSTLVVVVVVHLHSRKATWSAVSAAKSDLKTVKVWTFAENNALKVLIWLAHTHTYICMHLFCKTFFSRLRFLPCCQGRLCTDCQCV